MPRKSTSPPPHTRPVALHLAPHPPDTQAPRYRAYFHDHPPQNWTPKLARRTHHCLICHAQINRWIPSLRPVDPNARNHTDRICHACAATWSTPGFVPPESVEQPLYR